MTLEEAEKYVGKRVTYTPRGMPWAAEEEGTVVRVGARYVFVQYDGDKHAKSTDAQDLTPAES